jgi:hypothetical protein
MLRVSTWASLALLLGLSAGSRAAAPPPSVEGAITKALPLLVKGGRGHMEERQCFACHNQGIPLLALTTARSHGIAVRSEDISEQMEYIAAHQAGEVAKLRKDKKKDFSSNRAGSALAVFEWGGWKADTTTEGLAEYLLQDQTDRDHWAPIIPRPPSQASDFTTTYFALRGLRVYGTAAQKERIAGRIAVVRGWLLAAKPKDTEDRVSRLKALREVGVSGKVVQDAVRELLRTQRADGGWGQLDGMASDAYATGSALVALHEAGGLPTTDKVYQRGIAWLLKAQLADGSWLVKTRSKPIQKYFESGFPHGKDQFISMAGTAWAVTALALSLPEQRLSASAAR